MVSSLKSLIVIVFLGFLAACATDRTFGTSPDIEITDLEELPEPTGQILYQIGPSEVLDIVVVGSGQLSGKFLTDDVGAVSYPLIGQLSFAGLTPSEASRLIADGLRGRYLLDPQVRVIPANYSAPSASVGGQVNNPGPYPTVGQTSLLRMVNQAGGLTEYAEKDDVLVIRAIDGQRYIGIYSIEAIQRGNYPDPRIFPNDVVTVGDSPARRRLETILQFVPLLSTAAIIIDRVGSSR